MKVIGFVLAGMLGLVGCGTPQTGNQVGPENIDRPAGLERSSQSYLFEGEKAYREGRYDAAIGPLVKALEMEKEKRELTRDLWIVLVDDLAMAHGMSGDLRRAHDVVDYGIEQEPTYPMFYYIKACAYGEAGDEVNALGSLRTAFKYKQNTLKGESVPDPMTDDSFARFRDDAKFKKAVAQMKR